MTATRASLALAALVFFGLAELDTARIDDAAFDAGKEVRWALLTDVMRVATDVGSSPVVGLVALATAVRVWRRGRGADAVALAGGVILLWLAIGAAKTGYGRERPLEALVEVGGLSYPSGHAAYSAALVAAAVTAARAGVPRTTGRALVGGAIVLALMVGLSRVYLRAHYLSDVVGGWALAVLVLGGVGALASLRAHS